MNGFEIKIGYVYHIIDTYFDIVKDDKLMRNYEGGAYRPTYFCLKDKKTELLWVIPMSSKVDKYQHIINKEVAKHGKCLKIVKGDYAGVAAVFLLQNMFPILPKYIDHIHTIKGNPIAVDDSLQRIIDRNFREVRHLYSRGAKIVFPDIDRLEKLMLAELKQQQKN